jgi:hypothetical protein
MASLLATAALLVHASPAGAQATGHEHHGPAPAATPAREASAEGDVEAMFLMNQSSGTSTQPASWPMPMLMGARGPWQLGLMAQGFLVHTQQSGPRGDDGTFAVNWVMGSASRPLGPGRLQFRGMASLEPATVRHGRYPLLFQTGETAQGEPLVDGQHPHDLLMELSVQYAQELGRAGLFHVYYAPVGDAAMGPVAFPHRASALELPQATLGHHWQDSTHIASNVLTLGWAKGPLRLDGSAFHGTEPDEARWNLDLGAMNSWSLRASVAPRRNWMAQVSFARLQQPEALHADDVDRTTASIHHVAPRSDGSALATTAIWATNRKSLAGTRTHAFTLESVVPIAARNFVSTRFEWSQRDELFENDHALADRLALETGRTAFDVSGLTLGYTRDLPATERVQVGLGGTVTRYWADAALTPYYGARPTGATVFVRVRARSAGSGTHRH